MNTVPAQRVKEMLTAWREGQTRDAIAKQHGVSLDAVRGAIERWEWWRPEDRPAPREHRCLRCRELFMAEGRGNWICTRCKHNERYEGRDR